VTVMRFLLPVISIVWIVILNGLSDGDEVNLHKTNATKSDTDNDGAKETGYISRH